jgi:hypothetical protein
VTAGSNREFDSTERAREASRRVGLEESIKRKLPFWPRYAINLDCAELTNSIGN